jgi:signal transduction histidine kinase
MRLWPRTLGVQLIVLTVAAVFASNVAVAVWFEMGSERLTESALNERILDRAAATATTLNVVSARARAAVARAMSSPAWQFELQSGKDVAGPMNPAEQKLAQRLKAMLPAKEAKFPVTVKFMHVKLPPLDPAPRGSWREGDGIVITMPVVRNTQLVATFVRPPAPEWPFQVAYAALIAIIVASGAAALIARRMTRPLSHLASAASLAAAGGAAPRVPEEGPADVRKAAVAFNAMMDQVTRTLESQRQLLSAVGHDLRTPITAMRINLEFVKDDELRERLERNLTELQELTEAVLSAARGTGGEARRRIDLSALIDSVCADLDDLGQPVHWASHAPAPLSCRPNEVRRAVRNLVENAVAYGKKADVQLAATNTAYEVVVEDDGPGIPEADQARVFEPFVRLESSRNAETGGTGLGLTLVKAIAESHGGTVALENRAEGGLRARLRLPRDQPAV